MKHTIEALDRFKIGTSEITEFRAKQNGTLVKGAGNTEAEVIVPTSDPRFNLPAIYFLLGEQVIQSVH